MRQQVNLLTDELKPKRDPFTFGQLLMIWASLGLVLLLTTGWGGAALWQLTSEQSQTAEQLGLLKQANQQLKSSYSATPDAGLAQEVAALKKQHANQEKLMSVLMGYSTDQTAGFSRYLDDLAEHQIKGMWLKEINLARGGNWIQLKGITADPVRLPVFLKELSKGESFQGHLFDGFQLEEEESGLLRFDIAGPDEDA